MLSQEQRDLIHQEIDGQNTPEASAEFRALVQGNPEARALASELRELSGVLGGVEQREPPPALRGAILDAVGQPRVSPHAASAWVVLVEFVRTSLVQFRSATIRMETAMATKKAFLIGSSAVAAIAIIGFVAIGYPPNGNEVGTIGGLTPSDSIGGVQQASRYRNRAITERDITISNPEIQVLFQNHEILTLVKSDVFREAMNNEAFRSLQSNEAFRAAMAMESFRQLMASESFRAMMSSEAFRAAQAQDAFRAAQNTEAARAAQNTEAYRALQANESFRALMASESFRAAMANESFRAVMNNDAFRAAMANESFRAVMANDAFRQLNASEAFRAISRSAQLSEVFMNEAMRAAQ